MMLVDHPGIECCFLFLSSVPFLVCVKNFKHFFLANCIVSSSERFGEFIICSKFFVIC